MGVSAVGIIKRWTSVIICFCMILCAIPLCPFVSAQAQTPLFRLNEISNDSQIVVVSLELVSGGFNCVDFRFSFENVKCTKAKKGDAYNDFVSGSDESPLISYNINEVPEDCYNLSIISMNVYDSVGAILELTLEITDETSYSFSVSAVHCAVFDDENGQVIVFPSVEGRVTSHKTPLSFTVTESGRPIYNAAYKIDLWRPYSSKKLYLGVDADFDYETVRWSSSNSKVSVSSNGTVVNKGFFSRKADITVSLYGNDGEFLAKRTVSVIFYKFDWQFKNLY